IQPGQDGAAHSTSDSATGYLRKYVRTSFLDLAIAIKMSAMPGPTLSRLLLGKEIRQLREAAGISREQAAAALKCSKARIDHIEVGRNAMGYAELVMLLRDHYGAEHRVGELEALRERASQRGWWSTAGLSDWLARYVGLESDATSIRT